MASEGAGWIEIVVSLGLAVKSSYTLGVGVA